MKQMRCCCDTKGCKIALHSEELSFAFSLFPSSGLDKSSPSCATISRFVPFTIPPASPLQTNCLSHTSKYRNSVRYEMFSLACAIKSGGQSPRDFFFGAKLSSNEFLKQLADVYV